MSQAPTWEIPTNARPDQSKFDFDLDLTLSSVVAVHARIPEDAYTAGLLGAERQGNGVVISDKGLVLTIGYLITEATEIWLTTNSGTVVQADVLAYDQVSGFGLLQARAPTYHAQDHALHALAVPLQQVRTHALVEP